MHVENKIDCVVALTFVQTFFFFYYRDSKNDSTLEKNANIYCYKIC